MNKLHRASLIVFLIIACADLTGFAAEPTIGHDLTVTLLPADGRLRVHDRVTLPEPSDSIEFELHAGLEPKLTGPGTLTPLDEASAGGNDVAAAGGVPVRRWRVDGISSATFELDYAGRIHHPIETGGEEYARSFSGTPGLIDPRGVVLSASTCWYPRIGERLVHFDLTTSVPDGWRTVSQGHRVAGKAPDHWHCPHPMDDIYLIAAPFTEYSRSTGRVTAQAFLREPDPNLAAKYLETTAQYLAMYEQLIGPYPYEKFALVENFWETGYGMPSFTLLGPRIIRFPFILHSSYPHEILHNWWGNSVFVDYETGNWCEGMTAYLADHLVKEGQGRGREYRRDTLDAYRNYVDAGRDFPLSQFKSRHSAATQAVGYGKCLMLWHMLRRELGDDVFGRGLRRFYRAQRFKRAGFADLARAFSDVAGRDLSSQFAQWVERPGAPELRIEWRGESLVLRQVQSGPIYDMLVPVALTYRGEAKARIVVVHSEGREVALEIDDLARVDRVDVDPDFDVFRRLDSRETPASFGQLFGADRVTIVVPDSGEFVTDWAAFAKSWATTDSIDVVSSAAFAELPADRAVWFLGDTKVARAYFESRLHEFGAAVGDARIEFGVADVPRADHCFALALSHPQSEGLAIGWIDSTRRDALAGLARKLPHYGKYSYLAFGGAEPSNVAKGQWPSLASPLVWMRTPGVASGSRPTRQPLARLAPVFDPDKLLSHIEVLAADAMEGRGVGTAGLDRSADYIAQRFAAIGLEPLGDDGSFFETFDLDAGPDGKPAKLKNVVGVLRGSDGAWADQCVVIGAHYDHLGRGWPDVRAGEEGKIHNGADDNASGVAVMLEVAALLKQTLEPRRSVVFVAFSGEECGLKGSHYYVSRPHGAFTTSGIFAMVNLDAVGRLEGRKLMVFGASSAYEWPHVAMGIAFTTGVESNVVASEVGASDHISFHEVGVPAIHIFGGANPDYHRPTDDIDKIDRAGLIQIATWLRECVVYLSEREQPFKVHLAGKGAPKEPTQGGRRASLGTMPDFAFAGPGVRVAAVMSGSAAEQAGLQVGDVLLAVAGRELADLKAFSDALKHHQPGDRVSLRVRRGDRRLDLQAVLRER